MKGKIRELIMLIDIYEEEVVGVHSVGCIITDKEAARIISKQFGFIEWLVQNDKINKRKIDTRLVRYVESYYDEEGYWIENSYEDYSDTNTLLMLLAISENPIEDLISYLN